MNTENLVTNPCRAAINENIAKLSGYWQDLQGVQLEVDTLAAKRHVLLGEKNALLMGCQAASAGGSSAPLSMTEIAPQVGRLNAEIEVVDSMLTGATARRDEVQKLFRTANSGAVSGGRQIVAQVRKARERTLPVMVRAAVLNYIKVEAGPAWEKGNLGVLEGKIKYTWTDAVQDLLRRCVKECGLQVSDLRIVGFEHDFSPSQTDFDSPAILESLKRLAAYLDSFPLGPVVSDDDAGSGAATDDAPGSGSDGASGGVPDDGPGSGADGASGSVIDEEMFAPPV